MSEREILHDLNQYIIHFEFEEDFSTFNTIFNGHSLESEGEFESISIIDVNETKSTYASTQFHFHALSEHTFHGLHKGIIYFIISSQI